MIYNILIKIPKYLLQIPLLLFPFLGACSFHFRSSPITASRETVAIVEELKSPFRSKGQRIFRLDPILAKEHSHDVSFLQDLLIHHFDVPFEHAKLLPVERLDVLSRCDPTLSRRCISGEDDSIFIPKRVESNVWLKYRGRDRIFSVTQDSSRSFLNEEKPIQLEENGKRIFSAQVCQGTYDYPLLYARLIDGLLAFEYLEGQCFDERSGQTAKFNSYYDGININQTYHVKGSRQVFSYKNRIGFVMDRGQREVIFFNGREVSTAFDCIRGFNHEDPTPPLLEVYDNGTLLFGARLGRIYYLGLLDLNQFL